MKMEGINPEIRISGGTRVIIHPLVKVKGRISLGEKTFGKYFIRREKGK